MLSLTSPLSRVAVVAGLLAVCLCGRPAQAVEVGWGFDSSALAPIYTNSATYMSFFNGATTSSVVSFGTASGMGIPAMPGGDASVMHFPAFAPNQGITVDEFGPTGNGGGAGINQYTLAWDVLFPDIASHAYTALYNTASPANSDDAKLFIRNHGGIGKYGQYDPPGSVTANTWHRIVIVVDQAAVLPDLTPAPTMKKFVNGVLVATQEIDALDQGHTVLPNWYPDYFGVPGPPTTAAMFLLTDDDNETNEGYISAFYYADRMVDDATIGAWGSAKTGGIPGPGDVNFDGIVNIFDIYGKTLDGNSYGDDFLTNACWMLLPYIEQQSLKNLYDPNIVWYNNSPAVAVHSIPSFLCPSNGDKEPLLGAETPAGKFFRDEIDLPIWPAAGGQPYGLGLIDYAFCKGVTDAWCWNPDASGGTAAGPVGVVPVGIPAREKGIFNVNQATRIASVTDGTSNTIMMGDAAQGPRFRLARDPWPLNGSEAGNGAGIAEVPADPKLGPFFAMNAWPAGQPNVSSTGLFFVTTIAGCTRDPLNRKLTTHSIINELGFVNGGYCPSTITSAAVFHRSSGFRSDHPGIGNFLFGDGSVHILRDEIEFRLPTAGGTPQTAGVYQALSTMSGGESNATIP